MKSVVHCFDLDGTVIDSFHRVAECLDHNGNLDLNKYCEQACKHDKIMKDTFLPLYHLMTDLLNKGEIVVICTARLMGKSDYFFLRKAGLKRVRFIASRDRLGKWFAPETAKAVYSLSDAEYKRHWLEYMKGLFLGYDFIVYDDHKGVLNMAESLGYKTVDANAANTVADTFFQMGFESGIDDIISDLEETVFINTGIEL